MNNFERVYQIDPERESAQEREKHPSLALSDLEHLEKIRPISIKVEPPAIPMKLEMPILEETIKKGNKIAKSKTKTTEKKAAKVSAKSNKPAMARIQKKL